MSPFTQPRGRLEIPLLLIFNSTWYIIQKDKGLITSLYSYEYNAEDKNSDRDDDDEME